MRLMALDLHQDNMVVAQQDVTHPHPAVQIRRVPLTAESLGRFLQDLTDTDILVMESTMNAFWLVHQIGNRVHACKVLDTNAVHLRGNKTDALDARKLLAILSTYVITGTLEQMPTVYVPSPPVVKLRALFQTYRLVTKILTQVKNRIHGIFRQNGLVLERRWLQEETPVSQVPIPQTLGDYWGEQLQLLLEELDGLRGRLVRLRQAILNLGLSLYGAEVRLLTTIPGISPFLAVALMSDIVDIHRFPSAKKLCAYLRTAPSIRASNKTCHLGSISKQGRSLSMTLMTQSVNHFKTASPALSGFYTRLRAGKKACTCRVALIRKVVVTVFYLLQRGKPFQAVNPKKVERKYRDLRALLRSYAPPEQGAPMDKRFLYAAG